MFKFIKNKMIKRSRKRGGITFSDADMMKINSKYKYIIDNANHKIILVLAEDELGNARNWEEDVKKLGIDETAKAFSGSISRKKRGSKGFVPLVDIRNKEAMHLFESYDYLQVSIFEDTILVEGYEDKNDSPDQKNKSEKVVDSTSLQTFAKKKFSYTFIREQVEQLSLDLFSCNSADKSSFANKFKDGLKQVPLVLKVASLFSGAGMMDQAFKDIGYDICFAIEKEKDAAETYKHNIGDHIICGDILNTDMSLMQDATVIIGGPPCQGFSSANRQTNYLDNPNNRFIRSYIDAVKANKDCQVFVLENVPQLLTAGDGAFKNEILSELKDFEITSGVLRATEFGCPQDRSRAFVIGSKIGKIDLPKPTHKLNQFCTVEDAFRGLTDDIPNQLDFSKAKSTTLERMRHVKQGQNWKAIPDNLKTAKMLNDTTHSSIYRRLKNNEPSCTITNVRKSNILHPFENRILSVREAARLFGLKDNFIFKGLLSSKQQQVANGVPYQLSMAVAKVVKKAIEKFNIAFNCGNSLITAS
ncbi:DNA cytosine methyltransferase [Rummeliibacillus pycnus]|uniref:DNA cytosine methyltransferase n=1 Tax=Rummeliibacillus pycnus TaxID=101070 RepID=UPI003D2E362A